MDASDSDPDMAMNLSPSTSDTLQGDPGNASSSIEGVIGNTASELPSHDDDDDDDDDDNDDDDDYDPFADDNDDEDDDDGDAYAAALQSHFDKLDFSAGVETSFGWLKTTDSGGTVAEAKNSATAGQTALSEASTSSIKAHADSSSNSEVEANRDNSTKAFSQFDVVASFSDHHFGHFGVTNTQPRKNWAKKIQEEWKILSTDLPETIYVRVSEARMELLRAVIVGPQGTPYHDGLFVFDCIFPPDYPQSPPSVFYYSGGVRLNPNLYDNGKVCLSLLGTWLGNQQNENWIPDTSTMLQVLVSIQGLILNEQPYFNEPGYESLIGPQAVYDSRQYNENVFVLSLKTMIYTLRRPPKHFEELTAQHFRDRARNILSACKAYVAGALVGCDIEEGGGFTEENEVDDQRIKGFKEQVTSMMKLLVSAFSRNGTTDCGEFQDTVRAT